MKQIEVVAAILKDGDRILATQRGYGKFKGMWEFPGGKIEIGESEQEALRREMREELDADIIVGEKLRPIVEHDYPDFHLKMHCYQCTFAESGHNHVLLKEHLGARWLSVESLRSVEWLPADASILDIVEKIIQ